MKTLFFFVLVFIFVSCDSKESKNPASDDRLQELRILYKQKLSQAETLSDNRNGWLTPNDCDGMIWTGKYASASEVSGVSIRAAEYPDEQGRFSRRPEPYCWSEETGDNGAKTTWSRDMAICGLFIYAWRKQDVELLRTHANYGISNNWQMGKPFNDGRVVYTPSLIGLLYQMIYALGGENSVNRLWPDTYQAGLTDYEAHLQMCSIYLRGSISAIIEKNDAIPHTITEMMYDRIREHAARETQNPFYQFLDGVYSGQMSKTIDLLLDPSMPMGSYVRCQEIEKCKLAEWIFVTDLLFEHYGQ